MTVGIIAAIAVVVGVGAGFALIPATIGTLWMTVNLAPIEIGGAELGFSPLLPAMLLIYLHSRRATAVLGNSISVRGLRVFTTLSLLVPMVLTLVAWLMLWDAGRVYDVTAPNLLTALVATALVNGAAVVIGMRPRVWRALLLRRELPTWPVESFRLAGRFLGWMMVAGLVVAAAYTLGNLSAATESYRITSDALGVVGLTLVAIAYIPNIALGAAAVLLGGEFHIGHGAVSLFTADNVNLPPVPTLAAVPNAAVPYGGLLLIVPAVVSVWTVYRFVRSRGFIESPLLLAVGSGAAAGFAGFCLAWLGGGELGVYGHAGPIAWLFAVELAAWLLVPAAVVMFFVSRAGRRVVEDVPAGEGEQSEGGVDASVPEEDEVQEPKVQDEVDEGDAEPGSVEVEGTVGPEPESDPKGEAHSD